MPTQNRRSAVLPFCCLLLAAAGCRTVTGPQAERVPPQPLNDASYAQALAHYSAGLLEAERGHTNIASRAFAAANRIDPDSHRPLDALAIRLLLEKRPGEAFAKLEAFFRDHPRDVGVCCDLARLAEMNGDAARAARYYEIASRLRPEDPSLALAHIRALFAERHDADALRAMRRLNHACPTVETRHLPVLWALEFFRNAHAPERALPCIDLAVELATGATQRVELRLFYGGAALAAGHTNEAVHTFRQILAQQPAHLPAVMCLAGALEQRDGARAIATQKRRVVENPDDVKELLTLAALHLAAHEPTNAVPVLACVHHAMLAQKMKPAVDFYLLQGSTLDELGRTDAAAAVFLEALQQHPHAADIMNYLAYMWAVADVHLDEAAVWAMQAVKLHPRNGAFLDTLGWVRFRQQRLEEALDLLLQAQNLLYDDPTVLEHVGDTLAQLGRIPEAAVFWSRSYAIDATQTAVAQKLSRAGINPATIPHIEPPNLKETPAEEPDADESGE